MKAAMSVLHTVPIALPGQEEGTKEHGDGEGGGDTERVKRTLMVHIHDSLSNLALAGPLAGLWKPASGQETSVFSPEHVNDRDPGEAVDRLRSATIRSITVKEQWSTFPCPIGVTISGVPGKETTSLGQNFVFTVPPESRLSVPQEVYRNTADLGKECGWFAQYGKWNKSNLETQGVTQFPNQNFVFVHLNHPAVGVLRFNQGELGCDVEKMERIENDWVKVAKPAFDRCCTALRQKVLDRQLTQDLNTFNMQLHRLDAPAWDDYGDGSISLHGLQANPLWSEEESTRAKESHMKAFLHTPRNYIGRLEIEYEIPRAVRV